MFVSQVRFAFTGSVRACQMSNLITAKNEHFLNENLKKKKKTQTHKIKPSRKISLSPKVILGFEDCVTMAHCRPLPLECLLLLWAGLMSSTQRHTYLHTDIDTRIG